jgi:hypothetical protein
MSSLLVLNRVYGLEIQSVLLVFSTQFCELFPPYPFLWFTSPPPLPIVKVQIYRQCVWWGGVELCWRPYSAGV